tara:strand:- start:210 stop:413 length:204 start_codon:yes stop_codon:yes gene_type:complete
MKWTIQIPEVHYSTRVVEAEGMEEAIDMALEDLDTEVNHEYSHTLDRMHIIVMDEDYGVHDPLKFTQ